MKGKKIMTRRSVFATRDSKLCLDIAGPKKQTKTNYDNGFLVMYEANLPIRRRCFNLVLLLKIKYLFSCLTIWLQLIGILVVSCLLASMD